MQSGGEWLLKSHKQVPRPELTAVGMARKLQIKPSACRRVRGARLMRQQNFYTRVCTAHPQGQCEDRYAVMD
jgi:hypothetical protein